jgi:hypothetical protein
MLIRMRIQKSPRAQVGGSFANTYFYNSTLALPNGQLRSQQKLESLSSCRLIVDAVIADET